MQKFIVKIDMSEYFCDERKMIVILADPIWKNVATLQQHVEHIFGVENLKFQTLDGYFIPPKESLEVLKYCGNLKAFSPTDCTPLKPSKRKKVKKVPEIPVVEASEPRKVSSKRKRDRTEGTRITEFNESTQNFSSEEKENLRSTEQQVAPAKRQRRQKLKKKRATDSLLDTTKSSDDIPSSTSLHHSKNVTNESANIIEKEKATVEKEKTSITKEDSTVFRCSLDELNNNCPRVFQIKKKAKKSPIEIRDVIILPAIDIEIIQRNARTSEEDNHREVNEDHEVSKNLSRPIANVGVEEAGAERVSNIGVEATDAESVSKIGMEEAGAESVYEVSMELTGAGSVSNIGMEEAGAESVYEVSMELTGAGSDSNIGVEAADAESVFNIAMEAADAESVSNIGIEEAGAESVSDVSIEEAGAGSSKHNTNKSGNLNATIIIESDDSNNETSFVAKRNNTSNRSKHHVKSYKLDDEDIFVQVSETEDEYNEMEVKKILPFSTHLDGFPSVGKIVLFKFRPGGKYVAGKCQYINKRTKILTIIILGGYSDIPEKYFCSVDDSFNKGRPIQIKISEMIDPRVFQTE